MKNTYSLKENKQFKRLYVRGVSLTNNLLVLYSMKNGSSENRLGITVNKKVGKAVIRNRVRRLVKESYRLKEKYIKTGYDIVIVARVKANEATYAQISGAVHNLLKRASLLKDKPIREKVIIEPVLPDESNSEEN